MLALWQDLLAIVGASALPAVMTLVLMATIGTLVLLRVVRRERQACQAQTVLRAACTREHADGLLQDLQGVFFQLQAAQALLPQQPAQAASVLERALQAGDATLERLLQHTAAGRPATTTTFDLATHLAAAACALARTAPRHPQLRVLARGGPRRLHEAAHDGLLDAGRAALADALRHADGSRVEFELACGSGQLTLRVRGPRRPAVEAPPGDGCADLEHLCRASAAIGAGVEVRSGSCMGSEVIVTLPLPNP